MLWVVGLSVVQIWVLLLHPSAAKLVQAVLMTLGAANSVRHCCSGWRHAHSVIALSKCYYCRLLSQRAKDPAQT
jgi:hypothetical protein